MATVKREKKEKKWQGAAGCTTGQTLPVGLGLSVGMQDNTIYYNYGFGAYEKNAQCSRSTHSQTGLFQQVYQLSDPSSYFNIMENIFNF